LSWSWFLPAGPGHHGVRASLRLPCEEARFAISVRLFGGRLFGLSVANIEAESIT
jgi:hypothetical protein